VAARFFPVEFFDGSFHRTTGTLDQKVARHEVILPHQVLEITARFVAETVDAEICFSVVIAGGQIIPPRFDETVAMSTETFDKKRSLATFHFISPRALSVTGKVSHVILTADKVVKILYDLVVRFNWKGQGSHGGGIVVKRLSACE
jgi:hypothetical protein